MLLSELATVSPRELVRDGRFSSLGFLDHTSEQMLVALYESRYLDRLLESPYISCVITVEGLAERIPQHLGLVVDPDPKNALYDIHGFLFEHTNFYGGGVPTRIAKTANVHPNAYVAPLDVSVESGALIEPNATVLARSRIGQAAVIRAGSVIGAEGFGARRVGRRLVTVPHAGTVFIGDEVQILSNCSILRATFGGATTIGDQTIINAQSYIAHNVRIGKRCLIAAAAVIAGSARIGDDVWIGPNAVISNSVHIGDGASVSLGAVVIRDVAPGERVSGHFAMPHREFLSFLARSRHDAAG